MFIFNQNIIDLQCCVYLCYTTVGIGYMYTYIPCLLDLPTLIPSPRSAQSTELSSVCYAVASHQLFHTWYMCRCDCQSIPLSCSLPPHIHKSVLYVCIKKCIFLENIPSIQFQQLPRKKKSLLFLWSPLVGYFNFAAQEAENNASVF